MAYTEHRKQYLLDYAKSHKERIVVDVDKGRKEAYKQLAAKRGKSLTALIVDYLESELKKEGG